MENHQSECNFLSTVSIFSSPPLAARCPLSPPACPPPPSPPAPSRLLPLPARSSPPPLCPLLPLSLLASCVLGFTRPPSLLSCSPSSLALFSPAPSPLSLFPSLSPPLPSPSPLSRLCCPLLSLPPASPPPPLSSPSPLSRLRCPLLPLSRLRCRVRRVTTRRPPLSASLCLSLPFPPLCIFLYISSLFSLLLFLFSLLLTIFYTFLSPFSPFPPPSALSLRQMWNFPILPSATN